MEFKRIFLCILVSLSLCSCGKQNDREYTLDEIIGTYKGPSRVESGTHVADYSLQIRYDKGAGYGSVTAFNHISTWGASVLDNYITIVSGTVTMKKNCFYIGNERGIIFDEGKSIEICKKTFIKEN